MHGRADELHESRTGELGQCHFHGVRWGKEIRDSRRKERWDVEGSEDGHAVSEAEEGVGGYGDSLHW